MTEVSGDGFAWDRLLGPFFSSETASKLLSVTPEALSGLADELAVLRVVTSDGVPLYPSVQFQAGAVIPGVPEVLKELSKGIDDPWTWALWLASEFSVSGEPEESALSRLIRGDAAEVLIIAREDALGWRP